MLLLSEENYITKATQTSSCRFVKCIQGTFKWMNIYFFGYKFCYINYALHVRAIVVTLGRNCRKICTRVTTIILGLEEPFSLILLAVQYY